MKLATIFLFVAFIFVYGCGSANKDTASADSAEMSAIDSEDSDGILDDEAAQDEVALGAEDAVPGEEAAIVTSADESLSAEPKSEATKIEEEQYAAVPGAEPGSIQYYTVKKNETLMLVAFNVFGDYRQWKQLAKWNGDVLKADNNLSAGMKLKYYAPAKHFAWDHKGNPYLISKGDTLGRISNKVYQTPAKWRVLWENNKPMIQNPDLIFAGFTLYYVPANELALQ
jgi:nucleoid-associated protein YgaU